MKAIAEARMKSLRDPETNTCHWYFHAQFTDGSWSYVWVGSEELCREV